MTASADRETPAPSGASRSSGATVDPDQALAAGEGVADDGAIDDDGGADDRRVRVDEAPLAAGGHRPWVADERGAADDSAAADERDAAEDFEAAVGDRTAGGGRRFGAVALALAIVVGLLIGFGAGWLLPRLTAPGDDSVEAGFARDMINHHAQAVEMGLIAFQRGESPVVRRLGVDIAGGQQGEIGTMHTWLRQWGLEPTGSRPAMAWMPEDMRNLGRDGLMPGMASPAEITRLREAKGRELDVLFVQLMIRHHLGGVHMIDAVLAGTDNPEVVQAAQTMRQTQDTELTNLRAELTRLGGTPLPAN